jgi:hypothetical protein
MSERQRRAGAAVRDPEVRPPEPAAPAENPPAVAELLRLQQGAGNQAVATLVQRAVAVRGATQRGLHRLVGEKEARARAHGIWEEKGSPQQSQEQQAADFAEGGRQSAAQDRETTRRAQGIYEAKNLGGATQTDEQAAADWKAAETSITAQFVCDRMADWQRVESDAALWDAAGMPAPAALALGQVAVSVRAIRATLLGSDLAVRETAMQAAETAIDGWIAAHGNDVPARADLLMLLKARTFAHERRKMIVVRRIERDYAVKVDSMKAIAANLTAYGRGVKTQQDFINMQEPDVFSLEELEGIETVFMHYKGLLGPNRDATLTPQTLKTFGRAHYGISKDSAGDAEAETSTYGETFSAETVGMYDKSRNPDDFGTAMQQFRGVATHELSHALVEGLPSAGGQTMLQKFATDMEYWTTPGLSPYTDPGGDDAVSRATARTASKEPPPSDYGATHAQEDLAETLMFFFEEPANLARDYPLRFAWVRTNLGPYFDPIFIAAVAGL